MDCAFKAGALGVMAGYPEIEDVPEHSSEKWNERNIAAGAWIYRGLCESEGGGFGTLVYEHIVPTQKEAGAWPCKAGVDMNITYEPAYMGPLVENVEEGWFRGPAWTGHVRQGFRVEVPLGLFETSVRKWITQA